MKPSGMDAEPRETVLGDEQVMGDDVRSEEQVCVTAFSRIDRCFAGASNRRVFNEKEMIAKMVCLLW